MKVASVSSRECLDAPAILATFTAGRRVWLHVCDVITILIIMQTIHTSFTQVYLGFFLYRLEKKRNGKSMPETPPKEVTFQEKDEITLNYAVHSAPQISGACL